jgi:RNA 3'-terminal phosphate cyclase (ATP)
LIEVDGGKKTGSGTILRLAIALSGITGRSLHIRNIRQNRPQPGLKPQHLEAVLTAAKLCNAEVQGAKIGSRELWFKPGEIKGGKITAEIGTAGSIPLLLTTILPICAFSDSPVDLIVSRGGTDVSHAPTINYLRYVLLPTLNRMGLHATIDVHKYGYYPKGNGEVAATIEPANLLRALQLRDFGSIKTIKGVSVCTFLAERKVAERQAEAARLYLSKRGYAAEIQIVNDESNPLQKGSSLLLWAETDTGALIGADAIGEIKKSSEKVGEEAARKLREEITAKPTVDIHLADLLIPYIALAEGKSVFLARTISEHLETNVWLAEEILKIRFNIEGTNKLFKVQRIA